MTMGVYRILNHDNNKCYIGSSIDIEKRLKQHKRVLDNHKNTNSSFQYDYNTRTATTFTFKILEIIEDSNKLLEREDYYIEFYNSVKNGYNHNKSKINKNYTEQLNIVMREYLELAKELPIKIKIPYIYRVGTKRQTNLKIKIFTVLTEFDLILNNYFSQKISKKIVPNSITAELKYQSFTRDDIELHIYYTLIGNKNQDGIIFSLSNIYKLIETNKIDMHTAILKCIDNNKYKHRFH